jgi:dipeptidyl aminopeptidase/acylaminoacyl peptidase
MRVRYRTLAAVPFALFLAATSAPSPRPITERDLFRFTWIADPQISPDGSRIVYVRVVVDDKKEGYATSLWIVPANGKQPARPLTSGPKDAAPAWSPDGRSIAFVRAVQREGKQTSQLYVLSMDGGEARQLTDLPEDAGGPAWSPDGKAIAFSSSTTSEDLAKRSAATPRSTAADSSAKAEEHKSDVRVITRAVYRFNGPGYLDPTRHDHVWTVAVPVATERPAPKQLTAGDFDDGSIEWAPDGSRIYFTSDRLAESYYLPQDQDLYSIPAVGGVMTKVASIDGVIGEFAISPDGKRIAFIGTLNASPVRSYDQPDLFVTDNAPGATPRNLTASYDFDIGDGISSDQHAPRGSQPSGPVWSADGASIIVRAAARGRANLQRFVVASGAVTPFTEGDQEVVSYTSSRGGGVLALVFSTQTTVGDLFVASAAHGAKASLTAVVRPNAELFAELTLTAPEEIWYTSFDGKRIQAWIQKPPSFDASRKYPMILEIHGGPHAAYGHSFYHEIQWMAAKGYVVLYPNPRGSTSYGQEFGNVIQFHYPGDDYRDLMIGVDTLIGRGYVDAQRLGVTGGSGGGLLTNWVVTQTDRFKAAVSQRSIADWTSFWYNADFSQFTSSWFKGAPWQSREDFAARSPITYVERVTTPLMLVEGEADYRTPPANGGEQMFRALKYLKKPVVMVRFPEESHELSRSGKPWHRIERLRHIVNWFDKYLMGLPVDAYAIP